MLLKSAAWYHCDCNNCETKRAEQNEAGAEQARFRSLSMPAVMQQTRYFTYLWTNDSWRRKAALAREGYWNLDYAASNRFRSAGVENGSVVFIVTVLEGSLYLGGSIQVAGVFDRKGAADFLGISADGLRMAKEYIVAKPGTEFVFRADLKVEDRIAHRLRFCNKRGGFVYPRLDASGKIDRQTFRNARPLYPGAEQALLQLLGD